MRLAIANACFVFGVHWSLPTTARVAKEIEAEGMGVYPTWGAVYRQGKDEDFAIPAAYVAKRFSGPIGWVMSPDHDTCEVFVRNTAKRLQIPIEVHDPDEAADLARLGFKVWRETTPEFGHTLDDHLRLAEEGGYGHAADIEDIIGRHGLIKPLGDPEKVMSIFLESGLVYNIHAQTNKHEIGLILEGRGDETVIAALLATARDWGYDGLVTVEVNPFTIWPTNRTAMVSPRHYLKCLRQILAWVKKQIS